MDIQNKINDEDDLYRRITQYWYREKEGRVSSAAFKDPELSVNWARHSTPEETVAGHADYHVVALQTKIPREKGQEVIHNPTPDNYSHSLIKGKKTQSIAKYLSRNCRIVL